MLLYDEGTKRAFWKLAIVNELIQGSDNKAQAAVIRVGSDKGPARLLRSIQHLIPIEVAQEEDTMEETESTSTDDSLKNPTDPEPPEIKTPEASTKPRRHAAVDGEASQRMWTKNF